MTYSYKTDLYRFERIAALLATSRGADFLSAVESPANGSGTAVQETMRSLFDDRLAWDARRTVTRADVAVRLAATPLGDLADSMVEWIDDLPDSGGSRGLGCVFYWHGKFMNVQHTDDRDGPAEIDAARWHSLRACGTERPGDAPDPDPLAQNAARYRDRTVHLRRLRDDIEDWQAGPFDDFDLRLAQTFEWDIADGTMWAAWQGAVEYWLTRAFWASFAPAFSQPERDAILHWQTAAPGTASVPPTVDAMAPGLDDLLIVGPPCHPDDILRSDA